jgi:hypothetical protein
MRDDKGNDRSSDRREQDRREEGVDKLTDNHPEHRIGNRCDRQGKRPDQCRYDRHPQRLGRSEEWRNARLKERRNAEAFRSDRAYREWLTRPRQGCSCGEWR